MMKRSAIVLLFFFLPSLSVANGAAQTASLREMFKLMEMEKTVQQSVSQAADLLAAQTDQPAKAKPKMEEFVNKTIGYKALEEDLIRIYQSQFSEAEIQDMIRFFKTPTGRKMAQSQSALFSKGAAVGQAKMAAAQEELQKIVEQVNKPEK